MFSDFKLKRSVNNPILKPSDNWWENRQVCNPAVLKLGDRVHLFYTAKGDDGIARIGYAVLRGVDKIEERLPFPIFTPQEPFEKDSVEDPRITVIGDTAYMLYTGKEGDMARVCESKIRVDDIINMRWLWSKHRLLLPPMVSIHDRNAAYFPRKINGRYVLLHRPMMMTEYIWISFSYDLIHWYDHKILLTPREGHWDDAKIGIAGPPIEIKDGWLLVYHGVEGRTWTYRLGYAILDKENPAKVIYRCEEPILEPEEEYEKIGVSPNVVFSCGGYVNEDNELVLYYGAADKVICLAAGKLPMEAR